MPKIINRSDSRTWTCTYCWTEYETTGAEVLRLETACPDCGHQPEVQVPMGWVADVLAEWEPSTMGTSIRVVLGRFHEAATGVREADESSRSLYFSDAALLRYIALAGVRVDPKEGKVYMVRRKTTSPSFPGPTPTPTKDVVMGWDGRPHTVDLPTRVVCMVDGRVIVGSHEERVETVEPMPGLSPSTLHGLYNLIQLQGRHCGRIMRAHRSFFQDYLGADPAWEAELETAGVAVVGKGGNEDSLISAYEIEIDTVEARSLLSRHGL